MSSDERMALTLYSPSSRRVLLFRLISRQRHIEKHNKVLSANVSFLFQYLRLSIIPNFPDIIQSPIKKKKKKRYRFLKFSRCGQPQFKRRQWRQPSAEADSSRIGLVIRSNLRREQEARTSQVNHYRYARCAGWWRRELISSEEFSCSINLTHYRETLSVSEDEICRISERATNISLYSLYLNIIFNLWTASICRVLIISRDAWHDIFFGISYFDEMIQLFAFPLNELIPFFFPEC